MLATSEHNVLHSGSNAPLAISSEEARRLRSSVGYQPSFGANLLATHYRRSLADGSCLHLVSDGGQHALHRDKHDPRRNVASFINHLIHDAPLETVLGIGGLLLLRQVLGSAS